MCISMPKIKIIQQFFLEYLFIKESCNLIGWKVRKTKKSFLFIVLVWNIFNLIFQVSFNILMYTCYPKTSNITNQRLWVCLGISDKVQLTILMSSFSFPPEYLSPMIHRFLQGTILTNKLDWPRVFLVATWEQKFFWTQGLNRKLGCYFNFQFEFIPARANDKPLHKIWKILFWG